MTMRLIADETGTEITPWSEVHDTSGHLCVVEMVIDHGEHGPMVLISHEAAGAHLVFPSALRAHVETR